MYEPSVVSSSPSSLGTERMRQKKLGMKKKGSYSQGEATSRDGGEAKPALAVQSLRTEEQCLTASDSTGSRPAADGSVDQHAHNSVDEKKDPPSICEKGSPCINSTPPPPSSPLPETSSPLNRASSSSPPSSSSSPPDSSLTTSKTSTSPDSSPVLSDSTSPVTPDHPVTTPPVTNPASTPVPSSLSPTHPSRFYSRFGDTSLQIHRQWMLSRRLLPTPLPSDATTSSTENPSAHNDEPVYKDCESSSRKMEANKHAGRSSESEGSDALGLRRRECASEAPLAEVEEGSRLKIAREEQQHQDARVASSGAAAVEGERLREGEIGAAEEVEGKLVSMELTYVTERIIALWFPVIKCNVHDAIEKVEAARERMLEEAISMLRIKHATNCMIFDLSIPREADLHRRAGSLGMASHSLGWQGTNLAPPLERLCSACKYIESWLSTNSQHVAVLYSRGPSSKERIGVVISAYLTYSGICGSEEQALDRFAMRRFFQDKIGRLRSPSNVRYVDHFSGLLSGGIRMNAEPLFLTHITIRGAPLLEESKVCLQKSPTANGFGTEMANSSQHSNIDDYDKHLCFFLKIYQQGLTLAYTSPVYELNGSTDRLTIALENTDTYPTASPLHLRGDVLLKGYYLCSDQFCDVCHSHGSGNSVLHRHVLFQCQFHTCAVAKHSLRFTTKELDEVEDKKAYVKYPPDNGALELRFSGAMEPWPCPTQSIPLVYPSGLSPESGYAEPSLSSAYYLPYADEEEEQFEVGSIVAWDSIEELCGRRRRRRGEEETEESWANSMLEGESASSFSSPAVDCAVAEESGCGPNDRKEGVGHLSGPLDGSLYATVSKQPPPPDHRTPKKKVAQQHQQQRGRAGDGTREAGRGGMDRGSSPGGDSGGRPGVDARVITSRPRPGYGGGGGHVTSPSSSAATFSESFRVEALTTSAASPPLHAQLDELLGDMLMTVENIPDLAPSPPPCGGESAHARGGGAIAAAELEAELLAERSAEGDRDEDIPYHARKDGRPFTYGAVPEQQQRRRAERQRRLEEEERGEEIVEMHARSELSSPGLVRRASSAGRRDGGVVAAGRRRFPTEGEDEDEKWRRLRQQPAGDDVSSTDGSHSIDGYAGLTWLQRQQQKLRDRREGRIRQERCPQEFSLLRELRTYQRCSSASGTQTLPAGGRWHGREDGYASDTSLPVGLGRHVPEQNGLLDGEDEWDGRTDGWRGTGERVKEEYREEWIEQRKRGESRRVGENFTLPLRINTAGAGEEKSLNMSSEPGSPLLPRRSISREATSRYATGSGHVVKSKEDSTLRTIGSGVTMQSLYNRNECQVEGERPFVAVKRAHELQASGQRSKDSTGSLDDGMTGQVSQSRDDSFSSWATASVTWGEEEDDEETGGEGEDSEGRRNRGRPQTPAFPVQPRTPYSNGSNTPVGSIDHQQQRVLVEVNVHGNSGLPPKSPTTIRKDRSHMSVSPELPQQGVQSHRQPMMANGGSTIQRQIIPTTPPHSTLSHGSTLPRQQYGDHQEVSPAHVKFVRDTSRFWYKPTISREEAISILKDKQPGTFVVRDSNSFPGAFGLALKVATPPTNVANRVHSNTSANSDLSNELVRHFLIEPTSRGVKLKGCANEPVFSSLSALVYQHSLTAMALPCRLILPESEPTAGRPPTAADGSVSSNQILLQQGAACNVLYLMSVDTESLTGPQAVRRAVSDLFSKQPMPAPTVVHFKVSGQGITLTDNKRKLFFRRHYPVNTISHCGLDPDDHRWTEKNEEFGISISSNRCFGFVARKPSSKGDNQCHIFAELDPEQPATAIVNFVTRVMMAGTIGKTSNIV